MKTTAYLLIGTDGVSIDTKKFETEEAAKEALQAAFDAFKSKRTDMEESWIEDTAAYLYDGDSHYWSIEKVEMEVDLALAHEEFVTNWMYDTLLDDFDVEGLSDDEIRELAEYAYERYCEGNGETEYECIEAAYEEHIDEYRKEEER